jgi:hypothetical protein
MANTTFQIFRHTFKFVAALVFFVGTASAQTVTVKGSLRGANGYTLALLNKDGSSQTRRLTASGAFSFPKLKLKSLNGASLQIIGADGRFFGPVVLGRKGLKASTTLSGKGNSGAVLDLALATV